MTLRFFSFTVVFLPNSLILILLLLISSYGAAGSFGALPLLQALFAVLFTLGLLAALLLHECAHLLVSRSYGHEGNLLFFMAFGAMGVITKKFEKPKEEFLIAVAGPLTSFIIGIILYLSAFPFLREGIESKPPIFQMLIWLPQIIGIISFIIGVFNLIPAFPMDGGRILHSILWKFLGKRPATYKSLLIGNIFALGLAFWGGYRIFSGDWGGLWPALIGFWLFTNQRQIKRMLDENNDDLPI